VLQILQQSFNLPIWLTEWGFNMYDTSAQQGSYVSSAMAEYYSLREQYNVQSIMMYELIDMATTDEYGLIEADGATHKACYASYKAFTAGNTP
ncbi:MAG: glycosyl hydrolase, partial [Paraburkholderia sp.]